MATGLPNPHPESPGTDLLTHARAYHARGWTVIPKGKKAACGWLSYQRRPPSPECLSKLFAKKGIDGLAVLLGSASGMLACRDFDQEEAYHQWGADNPDLAKILPTVRTGRGYHVYSQTAEEQFVKLPDGEYRATSGQYVLLPPSRHPSGCQYAWLIQLPEGALPEVPRAVFVPRAAATPVKPASVRGATVKRSNAQATPANAEFRQAPAGAEPATPTSAPPRPHTPPSSSLPLSYCTVSYPYPTLHPTFSCVTSELFQEFVPTQAGERNHKLFALARRLKGIIPHATVADLEQILREWHAQALPVIRTKDFETSWTEFIYAWDVIRCPCQGNWKAITHAAKKAGARRHRDPTRRIRALCHTLQAYHGSGQSWPLSCRLAAEFAGISHVHAARILKALVEQGVLERTQPAGRSKSRVAATYRLAENRNRQTSTHALSREAQNLNPEKDPNAQQH